MSHGMMLASPCEARGRLRILPLVVTFARISLLGHAVFLPPTGGSIHTLRWVLMVGLEMGKVCLRQGVRVSGLNRN